MDFSSLFAQFAPQLGAAAPEPTQAPAGLPSPLAGQMLPPQMPAPRKPGAMDVVTEIAPLLISTFSALKGRPAEAGALMQGIARGREIARQRTIDAENRDLERKQT